MAYRWYINKQHSPNGRNHKTLLTQPQDESKFFVTCTNTQIQVERYEVEVDETRTALAADVFGKYLKTDDCVAVTDVISRQVVDDASALLEGIGSFRFYYQSILHISPFFPRSFSSLRQHVNSSSGATKRPQKTVSTVHRTVREYIRLIQ